MTDQPDERDADLRSDPPGPDVPAGGPGGGPQDAGTGPNEANNDPDHDDEDPDGRADAG